MDPQTQQMIHDELVLLLNREPTPNEIINGQTDTFIMQQVLLKKLAQQ